MEKEKKETDLDKKVQRSLKNLSVEEKLVIFKVGEMFSEYCKKLNMEVMSQEAFLNLTSAMWRGIRRGQNVPLGTILHIDTTIKKSLPPDKAGEMFLQELIIWTDNDKELLRELNKYLSNYLKDK